MPSEFFKNFLCRFSKILSNFVNFFVALPVIPPVFFSAIPLNFIQHIVRSSSREPPGISFELFRSSFRIFFSWFPLEFLRSTSSNFFGDSSATHLVFLHEFFNSSSRNSFQVPPEILKVDSSIPPDFLREILQSSVGNSFRVTPLLRAFLQKFLQSFSRICFQVSLRLLSKFLQEFLRIFIRNSLWIISKVLPETTLKRHSSFKSFSKKYSAVLLAYLSELLQAIPSDFLQKLL